jgi:ribosomal protein S2
MADYERNVHCFLVQARLMEGTLTNMKISLLNDAQLQFEFQ